MGIDAAGGPEHLLLRLHAKPAQRGQRFRRRKLRLGLPCPGQQDKMRLQRRGRAEKGLRRHIPVRAAVAPVHKAGLRRQQDLLLQSPAGQRAKLSAVHGG